MVAKSSTPSNVGNDTPETDAVASDGWDGGHYLVPYEFAQKMEQERNEAIKIIHACGLHPDYHKTITAAAIGAEEIIRSLRADLSDPPHYIQCAVLRKLGIEGFTEDGVKPSHRIIPIIDI